MNDFIQNKVIPFAQKIENNFILSAISGAFMKVMPALLGGAVFSLFQGLPLGDWYTNFLSSTGISDALAVGVAVCNLTALYFIFALGYNLGEKFNVNPFQTAIVSLLSLLLVTPFSYNNVDNTNGAVTVSYTHLRAHETGRNLVCRLLLEKKKSKPIAICISLHAFGKHL